MKLLVEFFYSLWVSLLRVVLVGNLTFDIVLIELHETSDVCLVVLHLDNLLDVLRKLEDDRFLLLGLFFLLGNLDPD